MSKTFSILLVCAACFSGCAYRMGAVERNLPGGYSQVAVPIFKNASYEPSIEVFFTNSLIREFERSKVASVTDRSEAQVILEGDISSVTYTHSNQSELIAPQGVVLTKTYLVNVTVNIRVVRASDRKILWNGSFRGESPYTAPGVHMAGINSVNPLYNLSARRQTIEKISQSLMAEAHDRITENF
ncbi:MAG: LptE family protein [Pseudobdellovibrionaceae bacterium]